MGKTKKKKRKKLFSVYATIEGKLREANFLRHLQKIYLDESKVKLTISPIHGGSPDRLLNDAFGRLYFGYNRMFVWIDEDIDISQQTKKRLFQEWRIEKEHESAFLKCPLADLQKKYNNITMKNPILIVSNPVCVESLILRTLGMTPRHTTMNLAEIPKQRKDLKSALEGIFRGEDECEYYNQNLLKPNLENKRKNIQELDLLISMITVS